ncbi:MAG TPA: hypothetical protein VK821_05820 [Dehalococcoidia bacterium]|nr:hypothetical protein [Dehalococcoidia bacterium]
MLKQMVVLVDGSLLAGAVFVLLRQARASLSEMRQWFSPEVLAALHEHFACETHGVSRVRALARAVLFTINVPTIMRCLAQAEQDPRTQTARGDLLAEAE